MSNIEKRTFIRYVDAEGRRVSSSTPGARKIKEKSTKWYGQFVDAEGLRKRVPLCTDKVAARQMLAELERQSERGRVGLIDPSLEQKKAPIEDHTTAYATYLRNRGVSHKHHSETLRRLKTVLEACKVRTLLDVRLESVEQFLADAGDTGASARTRNTYRSSAKAFVKWCVKTRRLSDDLLANLESVSGDPRRQRRALTNEELGRLLRSARERPVTEAMTIRTGKRKGQVVANIRPEVRKELERLGWERALMYKVMVLTGLRRGELQALEVRHLDLTGKRAHLELPGTFTKNGEETTIPLLEDLANDLKEWLKVTGKTGDERVFRVPVELVKILRRDLALAGIPFRDDRDRTIDVHALRHTTATILSRAKVSPRVAQGFMRHSDIKLTMQTYTDVSLLDENEALAAMPEMPIDVKTANSTPAGLVKK